MLLEIFSMTDTVNNTSHLDERWSNHGTLLSSWGKTVKPLLILTIQRLYNDEHVLKSAIPILFVSIILSNIPLWNKTVITMEHSSLVVEPSNVHFNHILRLNLHKFSTEISDNLPDLPLRILRSTETDHHEKNKMIKVNFRQFPL